jgi:hypothetical protein
MTRREALALLLLAGCGRPAEAPAPAPALPLALERAVDLVPAAGLVWLLEARTRELFASPALIPAIAMVLPPRRLDAFAARHGGVDLRSVTQLVIAAYPDDTTLAVACAVLDPARVERAFAARAVSVDGRAVEGTPGQPVVRTWGTVGTVQEQLAVFGREAAAIERGRFGPLRAAEYFALGRLKKARPALQVEPLARVATALGDAPLRGFAPGPFEGEWARGLGGLLAASTGVGVAATPVERERDPDGAIGFRLVLTGAWGSDAPAAAERLRAAFDVATNAPLGRLLGVDRPLEGPRIEGGAEALELAVTFDALSLGKGLHDVTGATVEAVMGV